MTKYAFLDTETTSLRSPWLPNGRKAWEVAVVVRNELGNILGSSEFFIRLSSDEILASDPAALRIGGFYDRHPQGMHMSTGFKGSAGNLYDPAFAAGVLASRLHDCHIVGANPAFDMNTLEVLLHQHGYPTPWHYRSFDVESIVAGHEGRPVGGLTRCAESFGIEVDKEREHIAMGDVETTIKVWDECMTRTGA